ncbi:hypothetical protein E4T66_06990 [Sinimarinibacterium sp. CAU 1509]|uniref:hypothetical protein n=1 Tax=Sinimarinibacterium sp. CAU 1509 TaxID=2562283 RepID=UPI0010AC1947|nr:hypothetical protein [Sinimarinibacterium sp. CAU 1509]TJY61983.1 hypothetical protein E4T66_06990 [Sinimarinibacterium sp. CAU 1509]
MNKDVIAAAAMFAMLLPPMVRGQAPDAVTAEDHPASLQACAVRVGKNWQSIGYTTQAACLSSIAAYAHADDGHGFRFATWGSSVLAIDQEYRYRSDNNGTDWYVVDAREPDVDPAVAVNANRPQTSRPPQDPGTLHNDPASTLQLTPALSPQSLQRLRDRQPPR